MCGFLGVLDKKNIYSKEKINNAGDFMSKRGPDFSGYEFIQLSKTNIHLVHKRLSIIDLSNHANQPFYDENKNWVLVYNGEIYNYREIRKELEKKHIKFYTNSDTEVIIKSFDYWGEKCLDRFIGMFSFMITNLKSGICYVVRDRVGVKPLYYYSSSNLLIFASDLRAINYLIDNKVTLNLNAVDSYFNLGYNELDNSYLNEINKLSPGCYLKIDLNNYETKLIKYWDSLSLFKNKEYLKLNESDIVSQLEELLISSFKYRMVSDVPVGVFLSGGYDSSLVSAILSKHTDYQINSYTIGFNDSKFNEAHHAKKVANYLGLNHTEKICNEHDAFELIENLVDVYDEPFGDPSQIPTLLVSKLASNDVKVILSADGGDEIFGGYSRYSTSIDTFNKISKIPKFLLKLINSTPDLVLKNLLGLYLKRNINSNHINKFNEILNSKSIFELMKNLNKNSQNIFSNDYNKNKSYAEYDDLDNINKMLVYDYNNYLEGDILKKVDRATMHYSIEGREPLLDHRIFEFMAKVDPKYKVSKSLEKKYLLKKITHKYLPSKMMERPKMGFGIPIDSWIKRDSKLKQIFFDNISESQIKSYDFFDYNKIVKMKNSYLKNESSTGISLWYLFNFIRWEKSLKV
jgi:asparagine synthase (glutamine-hydrolysing)